MKRSHVVPVILLSKSVVGASAVAFPRYFAVLGWPLALAMLLALAAATVLSTEVVLRAMHESRSGSYAGAVGATLGGGPRSASEGEGEGDGGETADGGPAQGPQRSLDLRFRLRRALPSLALEASGTAFTFGLLCVYNIVVADLTVGERVAKGGPGGGGSGSGGGGGLLCPPAAASESSSSSSPLPFYCSRPRFSLLLNALVLVPLSLRRAARDSKVPSAIGILSLVAWAAATSVLCFCAWLGGTLSAPSVAPDWHAIVAGSGGGGGGGGSGGGGGGGGGGGASWSVAWGPVTSTAAAVGAAASAVAAPAPRPPPPPLPPQIPPTPPAPPSFLACLVGLSRAAGLPTSGLVCQLTAPFIVGDVNRHSPREAVSIVREAGLLSASVYALLGVGAGALFGSRNVEANVLSNWQPEALAAAVPWLFGGTKEGARENPRESPLGTLAAAAAAAPPPSLAARLLSDLVRLSVAASLVTMYPLLMFPCRDGALRLWRRAFEEGARTEGENEGDAASVMAAGAGEQQLLLPEGGEEGGAGGGGPRGEQEPQLLQQRRAKGEAAPSAASHAASTLLLASCAALAALSSGDSAFDVLRLTGATAGAVVSYVLPAWMAARQRRAGVAAALAVVGAVMIGTAF